MMLTVYHLKTCDTCRKAIRELEAAGHTLKLVDVRADGIPVEILGSIVNSTGYEVLLNKSSTTWRALPETEKSGLNEEKAVRLMTENPTLIKRPVILSGERVTIGWKPEARAHWI